MPTAGLGRGQLRFGLVDLRVVRDRFLPGGDQIGVRFPDGGLRGVKFLRRDGVCFPQFFHPLKVRLGQLVRGFSGFGIGL